jgi:hypothetical protein
MITVQVDRPARRGHQAADPSGPDRLHAMNAELIGGLSRALNAVDDDRTCPGGGTAVQTLTPASGASDGGSPGTLTP